MSNLIPYFIMLRIDKIMRDKSISTQDLGRMMNVSAQYVSEVVNERKNITTASLAKFADALQVPVAALFDGYFDADKNVGSSFMCPYCGNIITASKMI